MPVTDEQVAWLRAYLAGHPEEAQSLRARATAPDGAAGLGALVHAAFVIAARRKFGRSWTRAEVTQFVAQVRRLLTERPEALDPGVAGYELRRALGDKPAGHPDAHSSGRVQFILLNALVQSLDLKDADVAAVINQAREVAGTLLGSRTV